MQCSQQQGKASPQDINIFQVSAYIPCANILLAKVSHMAKLKEWTPTLDGQGATKSPNKETYTHNEKNLWPFFFLQFIKVHALATNYSFPPTCEIHFYTIQDPQNSHANCCVRLEAVNF